jgi:hypothetical protein
MWCDGGHPPGTMRRPEADPSFAFHAFGAALCLLLEPCAISPSRPGELIGRSKLSVPSVAREIRSSPLPDGPGFSRLTVPVAIRAICGAGDGGDEYQHEGDVEGGSSQH